MDNDLIDQAIADSLYDPDVEAEHRLLQLQIWAEIHSTLVADLKALKNALPGEGIARELHRIRGYAATAGFQRLGVRLRELELSSPVPPAISAAEEELVVLARESIAAMEALFPHLVGARKSAGA